MRVVVLENIRSAYNVGNIIRTADALGWSVWLCGYTPNPLDHKKVVKTSLGAEDNVDIKQFDYTQDLVDYARLNKFKIIAAELSDGAVELQQYSKSVSKDDDILVIFGNEVDGILETTLKIVDAVVYVPMLGVKESMNVGQTAAIFMWELA